jgi:hypothetical protein
MRLLRFLNYWDTKNTIYRINKRLEKQENVKRKIGFSRKCALSSSKTHATFKKQTVGHSAKCIQVFEKDAKSKKSALKTTARQQSVIQARLKLFSDG